MVGVLPWQADKVSSKRIRTSSLKMKLLVINEAYEIPRMDGSP
jgi:hypothetical protein